MLPELQPVEDIIRGECAREPVDIKLVCAIIMQESRGRTWSYRFEPGSTLSYMPQSYSKKLFISLETEVTFQRTSWGLMQVMGFKARELGFDNHLPQLLLPSVGIHWGIKALLKFQGKFNSNDDVIAAYNAGSPRKLSDGRYVNQDYVEGVKKWIGVV